MFSGPENTIVAMVEELRRLQGTVTQLQDEVSALHEEVRVLKDFLELDDLMKGPANNPASNTLLIPQAQRPSKKSVHQEDSGGAHDSDGPYKESSTELLLPAAAPKEPPPRKAPPPPPPKKPPPMTNPKCPIPPQMRPHKAPPAHMRNTPWDDLETSLLQDMAGQGESSRAYDPCDRTLTTNRSHKPSRPDGQIGDSD